MALCCASLKATNHLSMSRLLSSATTPPRHNIDFTPSKITSATRAAAAQQTQQFQFIHRNHRRLHIIAAASDGGADHVLATAMVDADRQLNGGVLQQQQYNDHVEFAASVMKLQAEESAGPIFLSAELQLLANAALDRAEMHSILAQQRDNWNKLFQATLTSTSMTACVLSALTTCQYGGATHRLGLSLPAMMLNAGAAVMMIIINHFQPSQLAEEQRTAARLFRKLFSDIHYALHVSPHLSQSAFSFFKDCKRRLRALDEAFPMPLTPGGLEKFPTKVVPPVLIQPVAHEGEEIHRQDSDAIPNPAHNGWDRQLTHDLQHVAAILRQSDIPKYSSWAQNSVQVNKCLAIAAPGLAASAALLNAMVFMKFTHMSTELGVWAAICSVLATFASSFSNDMQLGMVFELYRNSAGYYADVETTIKETLRMPVEQRENGVLFRQRIAYQLGRWPSSQADPMMPTDAKEAGTLF